MRVVSDADVVIHLSKLGKLPLLQSLYAEVAVPEYVRFEILNKDDTGIHEAVGTFLKVFPTSEREAAKIARRHGIHIGEAHVKALGEELRASLFLSNERKVRKAAKEEGFAVAGTIGVILRAATKGFLDRSEAASLLEKMKGPEFRVHPDIIQKATDMLKET